jgi:hypothetical protein
MKSTLDKDRLIGPEDLQLFTLTDSPEEAVNVVLDYMRKVGPPEVAPRAVG